jgi:hypothetical protein
MITFLFRPVFPFTAFCSCPFAANAGAEGFSGGFLVMLLHLEFAADG